MIDIREIYLWYFVPCLSKSLEEEKLYVYVCMLDGNLILNWKKDGEGCDRDKSEHSYIHTWRKKKAVAFS